MAEVVGHAAKRGSRSGGGGGFPKRSGVFLRPIRGGSSYVGRYPILSDPIQGFRCAAPLATAFDPFGVIGWRPRLGHGQAECVRGTRGRRLSLARALSCGSCGPPAEAMGYAVRPPSFRCAQGWGTRSARPCQLSLRTDRPTAPGLRAGRPVAAKRPATRSSGGRLARRARGTRSPPRSPRSGRRPTGRRRETGDCPSPSRPSPSLCTGSPAR